MEDNKVHNKILIGMAIIASFLGFSLKTCTDAPVKPQTYTLYNSVTYTNLYKICIDSKKGDKSNCDNDARKASISKVCIVGSSDCIPDIKERIIELTSVE